MITNIYDIYINVGADFSEALSIEFEDGINISDFDFYAKLSSGSTTESFNIEVSAEGIVMSMDNITTSRLTSSIEYYTLEMRNKLNNKKTRVLDGRVYISKGVDA